MRSDSTPAGIRLPARGPSPKGHERRRTPDPAGALALAVGVGALLVFVAVMEGGLDPVFRQQLAVSLLWALGLLVLYEVLPLATVSRPSWRVLLSFALVVGWTASSLLWTESVERSYADLTRQLGYFAAIAIPVLGLGARSWKPAAAGWAAAILLVPLLALVSRTLPNEIMSGALDDLERLSYPLGYWNALACWCAMAVCVALAVSSGSRSRVARIAALGAAPLATTSLYLTFSRAGVIACAVGIAVVFALTRNRVTCFVHLAGLASVTAGLIALASGESGLAQGDGSTGLAALTLLGCLICGLLGATTRSLGLDRRVSRRRAGIILGGATACAVVGAGIAVGADGISGAREEFTSGSYPSQQTSPAARLTTLEGGRAEIWGSAIDATFSAPVLGTGSGTFDLWWARDVAGGEELREPHSLFLGQLAELGVVGFALLVSCIGLMLAAGGRACASARSPGASALTCGLTAAFAAFVAHASVDWIWESTAVAMAALSGIGIVLASQAREPSRRRRRRLGPRQNLALGTGAILAGAVIIPGIVVIERERASYSAMVIGRGDKAAAAADDAVAAAPWLSSPFATRALVRVSEGDLTGARADALDAISREPTNWRHRVLLAGIEGRAGNTLGVKDALDAAQELNPGLSLQPEQLLEAVPASPPEEES